MCSVSKPPKPVLMAPLPPPPPPPPPPQKKKKEVKVTASSTEKSKMKKRAGFRIPLIGGTNGHSSGLNVPR